MAGLADKPEVVALKSTPSYRLASPLAVLSAAILFCVACGGQIEPSQRPANERHATGSDRAVRVNYYIVSRDGVAAAPTIRMVEQTIGLNFWYQGTIKFKTNAVKVLTRADSKDCGGTFVNPEDYFEIPIGQESAALSMLTRCYADHSTINVFVVKLFGNYNGMARMFAPLNQSRAASTIVAANIFLTAAITLAHEVGHIVGFHHTATWGGAQPVDWITNRYCGQEFRYPHFRLDDPWSLAAPPEHQQWPGRRNPMGYLNIYTFLAPTFFAGNYERVFKGIISCWLDESFQGSVNKASSTSASGASLDRNGQTVAEPIGAL
jgi:hypothetical protein